MVKKKRKLKEMQWFPNLFLQKQHFEFFLRSEKSTKKSKKRRKLVQKVEAFILETDPFILFFFLVAGTVDDFF